MALLTTTNVRLRQMPMFSQLCLQKGRRYIKIVTNFHWCFFQQYLVHYASVNALKTTRIVDFYDFQKEGSIQKHIIIPN